MARRAFVFGSNANSAFDVLKYARVDCDRLTAALQLPRYSFTVRQAEVANDRYEVRKQLDQVALDCVEEDIFISYFSGHGMLTAGKLELVLDHSDPNMHTRKP